MIYTEDLLCRSWPLQSNAVRQVDAQQLELQDQVRSA